MTELTLQRTARLRAIILGGGMAGVARIVGLGCSFLLIPLLLELLGPDGFGLWVALQALAGVVGMLDCGIGFRLQHTVTEALATGRAAELRPSLRQVAGIAVVLAAIAAALAILAGTSCWVALLGIDGSVAGTLAGAPLVALVALSTLALPANLGVRLAVGLQRSWLVGTVQTLTNALMLIVAWWLGRLHAAPAFIIGGTLLIGPLLNLGLLIGLAVQLPRSAQTAAPAGVTPWFRSGFPYLIPQLSAAVRINLPPVLIAAVLGAAAVTPFHLIQRLLGLVAQPQAWVLDPLWPAYTDAAGRRDWEWLRRVLRWSIYGSAALASVPMLSALAWAPAFIAWWTGYPAETLPRGLLLWLVILNSALTLTYPLTNCLNGLGRLRGQMIYGSATVTVGLVAMVWAGRAGGLDLAVAPLAVIMTLVNLPCAALDLRRSLRFAVAAGAPGSP